MSNGGVKSYKLSELILIAEIAQILKIRDIRFCDDDRVFDLFSTQPDQLDYQVSLWKVDT